MLVLSFVVFCVAGAGLILLPLVLRQRALVRQYAGGRPLACPEHHESAVVRIDAARAAAAEMDGRRDLRLCDCTRWPERANCDRACFVEAVRTQPYSPAEPQPARKRIYHLPIFLAAFAAWYVGAIWHSQYLFRARWMEAVGLSQEQVRHMVWWLSPHLLTAAICVLFAYGVAWLLALLHRKGVLYGVLMALLLGGALAAATAYGMAGMPRDLLVIEAGYGVLATLIIGAIVGGLYDRLVLSPE